MSTKLDKAILDIQEQMVFVKGGSFAMGDKLWSSTKPVHEVHLDDFYIGKYTVTQAQWEAIMGTNPSKFAVDGDLPVESVSWDDVQVFLEKLNENTTLHYRLPTEAEWEYQPEEEKK